MANSAVLPWNLPITLGSAGSGSQAALYSHGALTCTIGATSEGALPWVLPIALGSESNMATLSGSGTLTVDVQGAAMLGGHGALGYVPNETGTLTAVYQRSARLHGHGRLGPPLIQETAALGGHGSLTSAPSGANAKAKLGGRGTLTSTTASGLGNLPWHLPIVLGQPPDLAVLTGSGELTVDVQGASALGGHGALGYVPNETGTLTAIYHRSAALHGYGSVLPPTAFDESPALGAHGSLTAAPNGAYGGRRITGHGALTAIAVGSYTTAPLPGSGTLTGTIIGSATLTGVGILAPAAFARYARAASFTAAGQLSAHAYPAITSLSGAGTLAGLIVHFRTATLSGHGRLSIHARPTITPVLITHNGQICNITNGGITGLITQIQRP